MPCLLGVVLFVSACTTGFADDLDISGALQLGSNYIDFGTTQTGGPYAPAPGSGVFQVTIVDGGSIFASAGVTAGQQGSIQSDDGVYPAASFLTITGATSSVSLTATSNSSFGLSSTSQGGELIGTIYGYVGANTADTFALELVAGFPGNSNPFAQLPADGVFCASIDIGGGTPTLCNPFPTQSATGAPEPTYTWLLAAGLLIGGFAYNRRLVRKPA